MKTDFDKVYAIMEEAFPACEIRTREGQRALLERPEYHLHTYPDGNGEPAAFLTAWEFERFRFIEHLAVGKSLRGGGWGSKIVADYQKADARPVILEVEPPETEMAKRRIGFYERLGFFLNEYPYEQPPMQETTGWCPLLLMSYPAPLGEREFQACKETLYSRVYGVKEKELRGTGPASAQAEPAGDNGRSNRNKD